MPIRYRTPSPYGGSNSKVELETIEEAVRISNKGSTPYIVQEIRHRIVKRNMTPRLLKLNTEVKYKRLSGAAETGI